MTGTSISGQTTSGGPSHEELIQQLGNALLDLVPGEGWRRIDLVSKMIVPVQDLALTVLMDDGSTPEVTPPDELNVILAGIRMVDYEPSRGAWFSARFSIDPPARIQYHYNHDHEPNWNPPIDASHYIEDLKRFPRDPDTMPEWLEDKIDEANEEQN